MCILSAAFLTSTATVSWPDTQPPCPGLLGSRAHFQGDRLQDLINLRLRQRADLGQGHARPLALPPLSGRPPCSVARTQREYLRSAFVTSQTGEQQGIQRSRCAPFLQPTASRRHYSLPLLCTPQPSAGGPGNRWERQGRGTPGRRRLLLGGLLKLCPLDSIYLTRSKPGEELLNPQPGPWWKGTPIPHIKEGGTKGYQQSEEPGV